MDTACARNSEWCVKPKYEQRCWRYPRARTLSSTLIVLYSGLHELPQVPLVNSIYPAPNNGRILVSEKITRRVFSMHGQQKVDPPESRRNQRTILSASRRAGPSIPASPRGRRWQRRMRDGAPLRRRSTNAEAFYYLKQMNSQTQMVVVLQRWGSSFGVTSSGTTGRA